MTRKAPIAAVIGTLAVASPVRAQWDPEVQLVPNVDTGIVQASGDVLHLVYSTGTEVHYRSSPDQGTTWSADAMIATGKIHYTDPIAASGADVYVLFLTNLRTTTTFYGSDEVGDLNFVHSGDGGMTWDAPCALTSTDDVFRASMDTAGSRVDVAWSNYSNPNGGQIYYVQSPSRGVCSSWSPIANLDPTSTSATRPQVASYGNIVHIVWEAADSNRPPCFVEPSCPDNYYVRSTNAGAAFEPVQHITDYAVPVNRTVIGRPEITVLPSTGEVVFVYQDDPLGDLTHQQLFSQTSTQNGASGSWSTPVQVASLAGVSDHPAAAGTGNVALLAWTQQLAADAGGGITPWLTMSADGAGAWVAPEQVSMQNGMYANTVTATSAWAHVVYNGFAGGPLYYRRRMLPATGDAGAPEAGALDASKGPDGATGGGDSGSPSGNDGGQGDAAVRGPTPPAGSSSGCGCSEAGATGDRGWGILALVVVLASASTRRRGRLFRGSFPAPWACPSCGMSCSRRSRSLRA